jgi:hypothetical protein
VDLLFPSTYTEMGISEFDFQQPRARDELRGLFERIGYSYKIGKFNAMFNKAREISNTSEDKASVRGMMQIIKEMHHME